MHPGNDRGCADELFASKQPTWLVDWSLPCQLHRADCDADLSVGGCEHSKPYSTSIWRHCYGLLFRCGKYHRSSDFPSRGCTEVFAGQDHCHGDTVRVDCLDRDTLRILSLVEQMPFKRVRVLDNFDMEKHMPHSLHIVTSPLIVFLKPLCSERIPPYIPKWPNRHSRWHQLYYDTRELTMLPLSDSSLVRYRYSEVTLSLAKSVIQQTKVADTTADINKP